MESSGGGPSGVNGGCDEKEGGQALEPPGNFFGHFARPKEDEGYAEQDPTRRYGRVRRDERRAPIFC